MSAALGIILLSAAVAVLLAAGRMRRNQQLLSDANEESRAALRTLSRALAATGVGGMKYAFLDESGNRVTRSALIFQNGVAPLGPGMPQAPDTLTILRYKADRRSELLSDLTNSRFYVTPDPRRATTPGVVAHHFEEGDSALITNFQRAMLVPVDRAQLDGGTPRVEVRTGGMIPETLQEQNGIRIESGASVFPVQIVRYRIEYVPASAQHPERGDLVMDTLHPRTGAVLTTSVLARDVEDLQVQWATDSNGDGIHDGFNDVGPTADNIDQYLTYARVSLSARTSAPLIGDKGELQARGEMTPFERGLDLSGPTAQPEASGFRRRVLSTVVLLKNLAASRI